MTYKALTIWLAVFCTPLFFSTRALPQKEGPSPAPGTVEVLTLDQATMCEDIMDNAPYNAGVVFSISIGRVICYSLFDPVTQRTVVYHNWYHKDQLITRLKLTLEPPRWATRSSIQLREADKGPWRVEVTDQKGHVFRVMRFSVTE